MLANTPAMLECHYGVPMTGGVLNTLNTRLDAAIIAFSLDHGEAKVVIIDREFSQVTKDALALAKVKPVVIDFDDPEYSGPGERLGAIEYEDFVADGDPNFALADAGRRVGRDLAELHVGHHRRPEGRGLSPSRRVSAGASATSSPAAWASIRSICGRCRCSTATAGASRGRSRSVAGTHVCLRQVRAPAMYDAIASHKVTHLCGAPIVMSTLLNAPEAEKKPLPHVVEFFTAAAPPPEAVLGGMKAAGFNVTHLYGLTETYGPAVVNDWHAEWDALDLPAQAAKKARQGVRYRRSKRSTSSTPRPCSRCRATARRWARSMFRGNVVMKGYLKNKSASDEAFAGGWFHSGDLGVMHPDGYIQLKDRSKDIIISGGENISSIEVEDALYKHPAVQAAAVVAKPDDKWGETPCAFVELKPGKAPPPRNWCQWCRGTSRATNARATWSSRSCRRPRPARSRSSSCGRWRRRCEPLAPPAIASARIVRS